MWNTAAMFKVTAAIVFGLMTACIYRRWFPQNFWQAVSICTISSAVVMFLLDTVGYHFIPMPGSVDEHIQDKTFSVVRSLALGGLMFLLAANYKLALLVADLFLFKIPNKQ